MQTTNKTSAQYEQRVFRIGRTTILTCMVLALLVPVVLWLIYDVFPPVRNLLNGILTVSSFMIPLSIAEILSFYPILGDSGLFMAYTTGNIANLKIPSAAIAQEVAEVQPGTEEGNVIATMAMAGSVIVCELLLILGVILIVPLSAHLENPLLKPAFDQILPALFGALGAYYILKNWKLAIIPLAVGIAFAFIGGLPTAITVPVCVLLSILAARWMYNKGIISAE